MKLNWTANPAKTSFTATHEGIAISASKLGSGDYEVTASINGSFGQTRELSNGTKINVTSFGVQLCARDLVRSADLLSEAGERCIARIQTAKNAIEKTGLLPK